MGRRPWYVSGSVGAYFREDGTGSFPVLVGGATSSQTEVESFDPGYLMNLALGHRIFRVFRLELELGYASYGSEKVNLSNPNFANGDFFQRSGADRHRYTETVNLFFDLPPVGRFTPFLGAGFGGSYVRGSTGTFVNGAGATFTHHVGNDVLRGLALVEGGVSFPLSDDIAIVPAYRYMRFFGRRANVGDEAAHVGKLGLRYSF